MKNRTVISVLVLCIAVVAIVASATGIFSDSGSGRYEYESIRGKTVTIYGKGLYRDMSADVAVQGIAQDYVTLFLAVPLLLAALYSVRKGSLRGRFLLAGLLNYFLVTYMMYLEIAMFNYMFLAYVMLLGLSFFALALVLISFDLKSLPASFSRATPVKFAGWFLIANSIIIAILWLSVVVPPLLDGSVIPDAVEHYTTLTVQGLDLALFLPLSFVGGMLLIRKSAFGYLIGTVTLVFLSVLMTALVAKLIGMALNGVNVIPAIFIIPVILAVALVCCIMVLRNISR